MEAAVGSGITRYTLIMQLSKWDPDKVVSTTTTIPDGRGGEITKVEVVHGGFEVFKRVVGDSKIISFYDDPETLSVNCSIPCSEIGFFQAALVLEQWTVDDQGMPENLTKTFTWLHEYTVADCGPTQPVKPDLNGWVEVEKELD